MKQEPARNILQDLLTNVEEIDRLVRVMRSRLIDDFQFMNHEWYTEDKAESMKSFINTVCRQVDEVTEDMKSLGYILPAFSEAPSR